MNPILLVKQPENSSVYFSPLLTLVQVSYIFRLKKLIARITGKRCNSGDATISVPFATVLCRMDSVCTAGMIPQMFILCSLAFLFSLVFYLTEAVLT